MIEIRLKSLNTESLSLYGILIKKVLTFLNIPFVFTNLPTKRKIITLLKSPHVNKSAREQFQIKTYKTYIVINPEMNLDKLKMIILNKPKTIKINIKKIGK
jgi:ribosomal protein S10